MIRVPKRVFKIVDADLLSDGSGGRYELLDSTGASRARADSPEKLSSLAFDKLDAQEVHHAYDMVAALERNKNGER